eukprot:6488840-Pyramimonas_sp.AAC.1
MSSRAIFLRQRSEGMFKDGDGAETRCSTSVYQEHFKDMLKEVAREVRGWLFISHPAGDETALLVARGCA